VIPGLFRVTYLAREILPQGLKQLFSSIEDCLEVNNKAPSHRGGFIIDGKEVGGKYCQGLSKSIKSVGAFLLFNFYEVFQRASIGYKRL